MQIGDPYRFVPSGFLGEVSAAKQAPTGGKVMAIPRRVTGTVVQITRSHRWFRVRVTLPRGAFYECFKF